MLFGQKEGTICEQNLPKGNLLTKKPKTKPRIFLTQFFHIVIKIFAGDEFPSSHKSVTHRTGFVRRWSCRERQWPQELLVAVREILCPTQIQWSPFKEARCLWQPGWPIGEAVPGRDNVHLVQGSRARTKALGDACLGFLH